MNKTIVLEPFSAWFVTVGEEPYLGRRSDRHEIRINFDGEMLYVHLHTTNDCVRTINRRHISVLSEVVQFVDKYIGQNYLPAEEASRILRDAESREKALQQQVAQLQAAVSPN